MSKYEKVGEVGVDAGCLWLGDPCYVIHKTPTAEGAEYKYGDLDPDLGKDWQEFCQKLDEGGFDEKDVQQFNSGCVVHTGYGDGTYPVFVRYEGKRVAEVRVIFIDIDGELADDDQEEGYYNTEPEVDPLE